MLARDLLGPRVHRLRVDGEIVATRRRHAELNGQRAEQRVLQGVAEIEQHLAEPKVRRALPVDGDRELFLRVQIALAQNLPERHARARGPGDSGGELPFTGRRGTERKTTAIDAPASGAVLVPCSLDDVFARNRQHVSGLRDAPWTPSRRARAEMKQCPEHGVPVCRFDDVGRRDLVRALRARSRTGAQGVECIVRKRQGGVCG